MKTVPFLVIALSVVLVSVPATVIAQTIPTNVDAVRKQIEANNHAVGRAIGTHDYDALAKYWAPNMVVNSPSNHVLTRDDVIAAMHRGGLNYTSLKGTTESFTVIGDIAIDMGHEDFVMASGPAAGKPLQRRYTDIWQRTDGQWIQIARQATILNADADFVYGHAPAASPTAQSQ